ncbi:MAG: YcaO-like family protein [Saccharolobus sp.]
MKISIRERESMFNHRFFRIVGEFTGIVRSIYVGLVDHDEPDIYYVVVEGNEQLKKHAPFIRCGGAGITLHEAMERAFGEFVERYCLTFYLEENPHAIKVATYNELMSKGEIAMNPDNIQLFSAQQYRQRKFPFKRITKNTLLGWVKGFSLTSGNEIYVPAQLIYLGYRMQKGEPLICPTTTSGAAAGASYEYATLRAIYESVERDAVMKTWYLKKSPPKLFIDKKEELQPLIKRIEEKGFLCNLFLMPSALSHIYTVLSCIVNSEDRYPKFIVGGSANLNPIESCYKALLESVQGIPFAKMLAITYCDGKIDIRKINDFDSNIVFYSKPENFKYVSFLLSSHNLIDLIDLKNNSQGEESKDLCATIVGLRKAKIECIVFDATLENIKNIGYRVVKVYCPQLISLSLPSYPFLDNNLFRDLKNKMPHPYP